MSLSKARRDDDKPTYSHREREVICLINPTMVEHIVTILVKGNRSGGHCDDTAANVGEEGWGMRWASRELKGFKREIVSVGGSFKANA